MNIKIELKNEKRIREAFNNAPKEFGRELQKAVDKTGGYTLAKVKTVVTSGIMMWKAPVDTGTMRRHINISQKTPLSVTIAPNTTITPYAEFVHQGTRNMKARPFLEITKETEEKNIKKFFEEAVESFVNNLSRKTRKI